MSDPTSTLYRRLFEPINVMPVIDCHEHLPVPAPALKADRFLIHGYVMSDLQSAGFGILSGNLPPCRPGCIHR
jgi:hypothetical protein